MDKSPPAITAVTVRSLVREDPMFCITAKPACRNYCSPEPWRPSSETREPMALRSRPAPREQPPLTAVRGESGRQQRPSTARNR